MVWPKTRDRVLLVRRNDTRPRIRLKVTADGKPVDFTTASAVVMTSVNDATGATAWTDSAPTVTALGIVEHTWGGGQTATAGTFRVTVRVTWQDGTTETFPVNGWRTYRIVE